MSCGCEITAPITIITTDITAPVTTALTDITAPVSVGQVGPQGEPGDSQFDGIASQVEAEAGTNNTKGMTPLRSRQGTLATIFDSIKLDDADSSHSLQISTTSDLSDNRTITLVPGDVDRTITFEGDVTLDQDYSEDAGVRFATLSLNNSGLHLLDTNASHDLVFAVGSDLTADKTLTFTTGDFDRSITLGGNPTLNDWFDQSVKTTASPTFVGSTLSGLTASRMMATNGSKVMVSVADLTTWVGGTENQVVSTSDGDGTITLSTPQNIHAGASPTFANLYVPDGGFVGVSGATGITFDDTNSSITLSSPGIKPAADSTSAIQLQKADGTPVVSINTVVAGIDIGTTNSGVRLGIEQSDDIIGIKIKKGAGQAAGTRVLSIVDSADTEGIFFASNNVAGGFTDVHASARFDLTNNKTQLYQASGLDLSNDRWIRWSSDDTYIFDLFDSGVSRVGVGAIGIGDGTVGDYTGTLIAGKVGILTPSPTYDLSFGGNSARTIWLERHTTANTAGNDFTWQSGGATAAATDKDGGDGIFKTGTATGDGGSKHEFYSVVSGQGAGTADRNPTLALTIGDTAVFTRELEVLYSGTQVKLSYDAANYVTFATQADGDITIDSNKTSYDIDLGDGNIITTGTIPSNIKVTTVNAATYDLLVTDDVLHVTYTATGAVTSLTLPTAQTISGRTTVVKDAAGNAATYNITIDTEGAETIDGEATRVISSDYESVKLYSDGTGWFEI